MNTYLKTAVSLADIPNPHPILMVGEVHDDHIASLYTLRSYKKLSDKGYCAYGQELPPSATTPYEGYKRVFDKARNRKSFNPIKSNDEAFEFAAICTHVIEAKNLGYDTRFIDMPHELGNYANDTNITHASLAIANGLSAQIKNLIALTGLSPKEAELHVKYANFGPKTYDNFRQGDHAATIDLDIMHAVSDKMLSLRCAHKQATQKFRMTTERDAHMADQLADMCQNLKPGKKIIAYGGLGHACRYHNNNYRGADLAPYKGLSATLAETHDIESTTVGFANPLKITGAQQKLATNGLKKEYLAPHETLPFSHNLLGLNVIETHFFLNNMSLAEQIHDLRATPVGIDYGVMGIKASEDDFCGNINKKIAQQLGLK